MGDARLLRVAQPVKAFGTSQITDLLTDLVDTMEAANGAGLAAPQIGKSIRLFIVDGSPFADEEDDEPDPKAAGIENFKKVFMEE
jgi:peptide deformylase